MRLACLVVAGLVIVSTAAAQKTEDPAAIARAGFTEVSGWITKAAETVPADKYDYRPVGTVRTVGQLVGHIADAYVYFCGNATGRKVEWADPIEKGATDKATVTAKLGKATAQCTTAYAKGTLGPLFANVGHSSLHYGNLITYLRMLGLTPPSS